MKKRILTMLLALTMIVSVLPFGAMADDLLCSEVEHENAQTYIEKEESDCIHQGAVYIFCEECGKLKGNPTLLPLASHTYKDSKCTVCGTVCSKHSYGAEVRVEATCEKDGSVTKTCTECGYKKTVKTLKATGHSFTDSVVGLVATCTVDGYAPHKVCSECGEKNSEYAVIKAQGHKLGTVKDVAATCTKDGVFAQECERENCEYAKEEIRKSTGHSYKDVPAKDPACTEAGYTAHRKCTVCGSETGKRAVEPTGHTYVNGQCVACGTPASGYTGPDDSSDPNCTHTSVSTYITSSDCTNVGYTVITCDDCHAEISREIREARGHTEKTIRQAPTCTEDGFVKVVCTVCNAQISNIVLDCLGHNYENGICTRCSGANSSKYTIDLQDVFLTQG